MRSLIPAAIGGAIVLAGFAALAWSVREKGPTKAEIWFWARMQSHRIDREWAELQPGKASKS